jgi:hypothetical protein
MKGSSAIRYLFIDAKRFAAIIRFIILCAIGFQYLPLILTGAQAAPGHRLDECSQALRTIAAARLTTKASWFFVSTQYAKNETNTRKHVPQKGVLDPIAIHIRVLPTYFSRIEKPSAVSVC